MFDCFVVIATKNHVSDYIRAFAKSVNAETQKQQPQANCKVLGLGVNNAKKLHTSQT